MTSTLQSLQKHLENIKKANIYKYPISLDYRMFPSDPSGSLDVLFFLKFEDFF